MLKFIVSFFCYMTLTSPALLILVNSSNVHTAEKTGLNDGNKNKLVSADWKWAPAQLTSEFLQDDSSSSLGLTKNGQKLQFIQCLPPKTQNMLNSIDAVLLPA